MTSSIVSTLLERVCGKYVAGIHTGNISVGLLSGKAVLKNLSLKPEALDDLQLPVCVTESHVGAITVNVASVTKVSIEIDELYLVVKKRAGYDWRKYEDDSVKNVLEMKLAHLQTLEIARQQQQQLVEQNKGKGESYMAKLVVKILENLFVSISRIHVRYEEDGVITAGVALGKFQVSTSTLSSPTRPPGAEATFKDIELSDLSVYCDVNHKDASAENQSAWIEQMRHGIGATGDSETKHDYLLAPTSGFAKCVKAPSVDCVSPKLQADVQLHRIALTLSSSQFKGVCRITQQFAELRNKAMHFKVSKHRSMIGSQRPTENARVWWRFALDSVLDQVHERQKWRFDNGMARRRQYMDLYKRSHNLKWLPPLTTEDEKTLQEIEETMENQYIVLCRNTGDKVISLESEKRQQELGTQKKKWGFKSFFSSTNAEDVALSEAEQKSIDDEIAEVDVIGLYTVHDSKESQALDSQRKIMLLWIDLHEGCSLDIKDEQSVICSSTLTGEFVCNWYGDRKVHDFQLKSITVEDRCTMDTRFNFVFGLSEKGTGASTIRSGPDRRPQAVGNSESWEDFGRSSLLHLRCTVYEDKVKNAHQKKRLEERTCSSSGLRSENEADFEFWLKMAQCDFVYSPQLFSRLVAAFETPLAEADTINAIYAETAQQAAAAARDVSEQISSAWATRTNWQVRVQVAAPTILCVADVNSDESAMMVFDLGNVTFESADRPTHDNPYEVWKLHLQKTCVLVGTIMSSKKSKNILQKQDSVEIDGEEFVDADADEEEEEEEEEEGKEAEEAAALLAYSTYSHQRSLQHVIEDFTIQFTIQTSILRAQSSETIKPNEDFLPQVIISGSLQNFSAQLDPTRLRQIMAVQVGLHVEGENLPAQTPAAVVRRGDSIQTIAGGRGIAQQRAASLLNVAAQQNRQVVLEQGGIIVGTFSFSISRMQLEVAGADARPLATLRLINLQAEITQREYATDMSFGMYQLEVLDHPHEAHLISSTAAGTGDKGLVQLQITGLPSDTSKITTTTAVSVEIGALHAEWSPSTLQQIISVFIIALHEPKPGTPPRSPPPPPPPPPPPQQNMTPLELAQKLDTKAKSMIASSLRLSVNVSIASLSVAFNEETASAREGRTVLRRFALLELVKAGLAVASYWSNSEANEKLTLAASLGGVYLRDSRADTLYPVLVGVKEGQKLIEIEYKTYSNSRDVYDAAGTGKIYEATGSVTIGDLELVYLHLDMMRIMDYILLQVDQLQTTLKRVDEDDTEGAAAAGASLFTPASTAAASTDSTGDSANDNTGAASTDSIPASKMTLMLRSLQLTLPRNAYSSDTILIRCEGTAAEDFGVAVKHVTGDLRETGRPEGAAISSMTIAKLSTLWMSLSGEQLVTGTSLRLDAFDRGQAHENRLRSQTQAPVTDSLDDVLAASQSNSSVQRALGARICVQLKATGMQAEMNQKQYLALLKVAMGNFVSEDSLSESSTLSPASAEVINSRHKHQPAVDASAKANSGFSMNFQAELGDFALKLNGDTDNNLMRFGLAGLSVQYNGLLDGSLAVLVDATQIFVQDLADGVHILKVGGQHLINQQWIKFQISGDTRACKINFPDADINLSPPATRRLLHFAGLNQASTKPEQELPLAKQDLKPQTTAKATADVAQKLKYEVLVSAISITLCADLAPTNSDDSSRRNDPNTSASALIFRGNRMNIVYNDVPAGTTLNANAHNWLLSYRRPGLASEMGQRTKLLLHPCSWSCNTLDNVVNMTVDNAFDLTLREETGKLIADVISPWLRIAETLGGNRAVAKKAPKPEIANRTAIAPAFSVLSFRCPHASVTYTTQGDHGLQLLLDKVAARVKTNSAGTEAEVDLRSEIRLLIARNKTSVVARRLASLPLQIQPFMQQAGVRSIAVAMYYVEKALLAGQDVDAAVTDYRAACAEASATGAPAARDIRQRLSLGCLSNDGLLTRRWGYAEDKGKDDVTLEVNESAGPLRVVRATFGCRGEEFDRDYTAKVQSLVAGNRLVIPRPISATLGGRDLHPHGDVGQQLCVTYTSAADANFGGEEMEDTERDESSPERKSALLRRLELLYRSSLDCSCSMDVASLVPPTTIAGKHSIAGTNTRVCLEVMSELSIPVYPAELALAQACVATLNEDLSHLMTMDGDDLDTSKTPESLPEINLCAYVTDIAIIVCPLGNLSQIDTFVPSGYERIPINLNAGVNATCHVFICFTKGGKSTDVRPIADIIVDCCTPAGDPSLPEAPYVPPAGYEVVHNCGNPINCNSGCLLQNTDKGRVAVPALYVCFKRVAADWQQRLMQWRIIGDKEGPMTRPEAFDLDVSSPRGRSLEREKEDLKEESLSTSWQIQKVCGKDGSALFSGDTIKLINQYNPSKGYLETRGQSGRGGFRVETTGREYGSGQRGATIVTAWYGSTERGQGADVTAIVRELLTNSATPFVEVSNAVFGDPAYGSVKSLIVTVTDSKGTHHEFSAPENQTLRIPDAVWFRSVHWQVAKVSGGDSGRIESGDTVRLINEYDKGTLQTHEKTPRDGFHVETTGSQGTGSRSADWRVVRIGEFQGAGGAGLESQNFVRLINQQDSRRGYLDVHGPSGQGYGVETTATVDRLAGMKADLEGMVVKPKHNTWSMRLLVHRAWWGKRHPDGSPLPSHRCDVTATIKDLVAKGSSGGQELHIEAKDYLRLFGDPARDNRKHLWVWYSLPGSLEEKLLRVQENEPVHLFMDLAADAAPIGGEMWVDLTQQKMEQLQKTRYGLYAIKDLKIAHSNYPPPPTTLVVASDPLAGYHRAETSLNLGNFCRRADNTTGQTYIHLYSRCGFLGDAAIASVGKTGMGTKTAIVVEETSAGAAGSTERYKSVSPNRLSLDLHVPALRLELNPRARAFASADITLPQLDIVPPPYPLQLCVDELHFEATNLIVDDPELPIQEWLEHAHLNARGTFTLNTCCTRAKAQQWTRIFDYYSLRVEVKPTPALEKRQKEQRPSGGFSTVKPPDFKVVKAAYGNDGGGADVTGKMQEIVGLTHHADAGVGRLCLLRLASPSGKQQGMYKKVFGNPVDGAKRMKLTYELDGEQHEAVYDDDDTICISVVKCYDHEAGINLSIISKRLLELHLDMQTIRALCSLSHPAIFSAPPVYLSASRESENPSPASATANSNSLATVGAYYWNSATALHCTVQMHGIRVLMHQTPMPMELPGGSWKASARNYFIHGNVLHAELGLPYNRGWKSSETQVSTGDTFSNTSGQFARDNRGDHSTHGLQQARDVAIVQLNRVRVDFNHHLGALGEEMMLAVGSLAVIDVLDQLEEPMAIATPNADAYNPNADRSTCRGSSSSMLVSTDGSHEHSQLERQLDFQLSVKRKADASIGLHLDQMQLDLRSPVRFFTGVPFIMRLIYWCHGVQNQLQLDAQPQQSVAQSEAPVGGLWTHIDHISVSKINLAVTFNHFSGNDNALHNSSQNKPADSLADLLNSIYDMRWKGLMKEVIKLASSLTLKQQQFRLGAMQLGVGEYLGGVGLGDCQYQSYSALCGQTVPLLNDVFSKYTARVMHDLPDDVLHIDKRQLLSFRTMVGRVDGDEGVQDIGDAARLLGQGVKLLGDVAGGGINTAARTVGSGFGALGMTTAQKGLNSAGELSNKSLAEVGKKFSEAGAVVGSVGGAIQGGVTNVFSTGISTLTGGKQNREKSSATSLPGGSWIKSARNYRLENGVLYAQLAKKSGAWGAETFVSVNQDDKFENKDGKFVRQSTGLFGLKRPSFF